MSLKNKAISGAKWTTILTIIRSLNAILKTSILARLLDKSDFGIMAIIFIVLGAIDVIRELGLTTAILYRQNITRKEYASLYWFNMLFNILLYAAIFLSSPFISYFYEDPRLNEYLKLMGITILFTAIGNQYQLIETKNLNFKYTSIVNIVANILSLLFAIILAYNGYGVLSLIYSALLQYAFSNFIFLFNGIKKYGVSFYANFELAKPFLKIGIYQTGSDIVNFFSKDIDVILIGKLFSVEILGGYNLAKQLARRPMGVFDAVLLKVLAPIFPRYQSDNNKLIYFFDKLIRNTSIINVLMYGTLAIFSQEVIVLFYGEKYIDFALIFQIYCLIVCVRSTMGFVAMLIIAKGKTNIGFIINIIVGILTPLFVYSGKFYNLEGIVISLLLFNIFMILIQYYLVMYKLIKFPLKKHMINIFVPLCIIIISVIVINLFEDLDLKNRIIIYVLFVIMIFAYLYKTKDEIMDMIMDKIINKKV